MSIGMVATVEEIARNTEMAAERTHQASTNAQHGQPQVTETIGRIDSLANRLADSTLAMRTRTAPKEIGDTIAPLQQKTRNIVSLIAACRAEGLAGSAQAKEIDRNLPLELPLSLQDWLPEGHLARYVVEVVEALDLSALRQAYAGRGSPPYHPTMMLSLLIYGYATGCYSSRKIEWATFDSVAFRFIACNHHPDHDTLATFRRRFRAEFEAVFIQVLEVARTRNITPIGQSASASRQRWRPRRPRSRAWRIDSRPVPGGWPMRCASRPSNRSSGSSNS